MREAGSLDGEAHKAEEFRSPGIVPGSVVLLGIPSDENSSFLPGAALAPPRIREALFCGASNLCAERGTDLGAEPRFQDAGNLPLGSGAEALRQIEEAVGALLDSGARVLSLGGDHAITYPIVRAYSAHYAALTILHLDAHPDLYDELDGNRTSHACPFARIMEEGRVRRLVQAGIRTMNPHQRSQAARFGVEVHPIEVSGPALAETLEGPVYLSLDLDVLDPAFAPGVSHLEPGGLSTRQVLQIIAGIRAPVVGADIVEYNPTRDAAGLTAAVAAKLVKEIAACMLAVEGGG